MKGTSPLTVGTPVKMPALTDKARRPLSQLYQWHSSYIHIRQNTMLTNLETIWVGQSSARLQQHVTQVPPSTDGLIKENSDAPDLLTEPDVFLSWSTSHYPIQIHGVSAGAPKRLGALCSHPILGAHAAGNKCNNNSDKRRLISHNTS